jgi:glycosyltransferase involved in cell wall biosynthesis
MEGFGIVFLEAALGRTPTVATRVGGIPEAVVDGETGLLTPPGDTDAMIEAITRLLKDRDLREKMGASGEARARTDFSWETICARYEESFRQCLHPATGLRGEGT